MQHMYEDKRPVVKSIERGLDVSDIVGKTLNSGLSGSLSNSHRAQPIRPKVMDYDIINPRGNRMRMSQFGKQMMTSSEQLKKPNQRSVDIIKSPIAGKKELPKEGEANIYQIWPSDYMRNPADRRDRGPSVEEINKMGKRGNARLIRLQNEDSARIRSFMDSKHRNASVGRVKTYKNAATVFNHLQDEPNSRQHRSSRNEKIYSSVENVQIRDALDRMMEGKTNDPSSASIANAYGLDDQSSIKIAQIRSVKDVYQLQNKGKRSFGNDRMNVQTGQARMYGSQSDLAEKDQTMPRRGKRIHILDETHIQNKVV